MEPEGEQQRQPKEANVERKECTDDIGEEEEEEEEDADAKVNAPTFYTDAKQYWKVKKKENIIVRNLLLLLLLLLFRVFQQLWME